MGWGTIQCNWRVGRSDVMVWFYTDNVILVDRSRVTWEPPGGKKKCASPESNRGLNDGNVEFYH